MFSGSLENLEVGGSLKLGGAKASGTGFRTGGHVKKTGKFLVHSGEYVLPVGVKPTDEQKKKVRAIKAKAKK